VLSLAAALLLALAAPAQSNSTAAARVDPRIELLGAVQYLAGRHLGGSDVPSYMKDVERAFSPYREAAAVRSYRALAAKPRGEEGLAVLVFCMSDPPELDWTCAKDKLPAEHVEMVGGMAEAERLRAELKAFARDSDFSSFFAAHRGLYRRAERPVAAELSRRDDVAALERYLGPLSSRLNIVLSLIYRSDQLSYIVPYPFAGPGVKVDGPFEVTTLMDSPRLVDGAPAFSSGGFWHELICVGIDPILADRCGEIDAARGLQASIAQDCQPDWFACASNLINRAVLGRVGALSGRPERFGFAPWPAGRYGDIGRALSARLEEYEKRRDKYPALRDFYPRLASVFTDFAASLPAPAGASRCVVVDRRSRLETPEPPPDAKTSEELKARGVWNFAHGRANDALTDLRQAVRLAPGDAELRLDLSVVQLDRGSIDEALESATEAVMLSGGNGSLKAEALSTRAGLWKRKGKSGEARADIKEALRAAPADWPRRKELTLE
jgi:tetratricopeptide (TPR) repeat protein